MVNRRIEYTGDKDITALAVDESGNDKFLWVAFNKNSSNKCILEKQSAFEPSQTYFTIDISVTKIVGLTMLSTNIYAAYQDSSLIGAKYSVTNPLTTSTDFSKTAGLENPVDIKNDGTDIFFLLPGDTSGTNAKILRYNTSGTLQETIDLTKSGSTVTKARSMDIQASGDIWLVTYTDPAQLVRVYSLSGGGRDFDVTIIT